jgi:hypothetical protein
MGHTLTDRFLFSAVNLWACLRYPLVVLHYVMLGTRGWKPFFPNLAQPRCANDKFFWRKVFDQDPRHVILSDKLACKQWVREVAPDLAIPQTLWAGRDARDIPRDILERGAVIKANHSCGKLLFVRNAKPDRAKFWRKVNRWLWRSHGQVRLQWGYRDVPRMLFAEEIIGSPDQPLQELKFYTFGSKVCFMVRISDRFRTPKAEAWAIAPDGQLAMRERKAAVFAAPSDLPLPEAMPLAIDIASRIGAHFDQMRVDLLFDGETFWLSELTVYNSGGQMNKVGHLPDAPENLLWDLRRAHFLREPPKKGWRAAYAQAFLRHLDRKAQASLPEATPERLGP